MHNRSCTRKTTETDIERLNHGNHGRHGKRGINEWRPMKTNQQKAMLEREGNWTNSKRNTIIPPNSLRKVLTTETTEDTEKGESPNEDQWKRTTEGDAGKRKGKGIELIRSETPIYAQTRRKSVNHERQGKHGRNRITEWKQMKTNHEKTWKGKI